MILDLRQPVLVIAGGFNPAIFSPPWMARNLFGIPEGEEVEVTSVLDVAEQTGRHYIQNIGLVVQPQRLAIYLDEMDEEVIGRAQAVFASIAETLPHTPIAAFGVNFLFEQLAVIAEVVDALMPRDGVEGLGQVNTTEIASNVSIGDRDQLNVTRRLTGGNISVSFNFHYPVSGMTEVAEGRRPNIGELFGRAKQILGDLFQQDIEDLQFQRALN